MGKAALDGLPGVDSVTSGWRGSREINTVRYDADQISIDEMVTILKDVDTFQGVAEK